jgi:hypothetical protein
MLFSSASVYVRTFSSLQLKLLLQHAMVLVWLQQWLTHVTFGSGVAAAVADTCDLI